MAPATLVCKQCNFENEPERVYCHNCGAKLDRSLLPPEATRREDPVVVQERVRKMVSPRRGAGLKQFRNLFYSLLIAAALAVVLLIIKPPGNIPELSKDAIMSAPTITDDLEGFTAQAARHQMGYKEDQVNAFLQYSVRGKENSSYGMSLKFERAFVHFQEGRCSFTTEQTVFGLPLYATTVRTLEVKNGTLVSRVLGGTVGSMPVPAAAMPYLEGIFNPIRKVLEKDRVLVTRLESITFHDKSVVVINRPAAGGQ